MDRWREVTIDEVEAVAAQFPQGCGPRTLERGRKLRDAVYLRCGDDVVVTTRKEWGMGTEGYQMATNDAIESARSMIASLRGQIEALKTEKKRCLDRACEIDALLAELDQPVTAKMKAKRGRPVGSKNGKKQEA